MLVFSMLVKCVAFSKNLKRIDIKQFDTYEIRGLRRSELNNFFLAYQEISGNKLPLLNRILYFFSSRKFVFVAVHRRENVDRIIGIDMYYCNLRDFQENTIHEGFIGVSSLFQRQGIATELRGVAIAHFSECPLTGISSRISLDNDGSLSSAKKLGFVPVEQYYDSVAREERYYLVRPLEACK